MNTPKYFICPMSKNIVDAIIELNSNDFALIPTRRQIDYDGGYVNNWNTKLFVDYVKSKSNIIIGRDHSGPNQGKEIDNGYISYHNDVNLIDIIHIDPWKNKENIDNGIDETIDTISYLFYFNSNLKYEVLTEEAIKYFSISDVEYMLNKLKTKLNSDVFDNIEFVVIQSGVGLDLVKQKNTGNFNLDRLKQMVDVCTKFGKKSKEHNGDYLNGDEIKIRFDNGLDSLNIGPEIAQIETDFYLSLMTNSEIDEFYDICLKSEKWKKWVTQDFDINNKKQMITVCGHYNFNALNKNFTNLSAFDDVDEFVKNKIKIKLTELITYV